MKSDLQPSLFALFASKIEAHVAADPLGSVAERTVKEQQMGKLLIGNSIKRE